MSLTDDEEKKLKHDIRNQLSNIIMSVSELKFLNTTTHDEYQVFLCKTIDECCHKINSILTKNA